MSTPELSFATPADLLAALPHLLGYIPNDDIVALMLGPSTDRIEVPLRAAIRCPVTVDPAQAQQFPTACHLSAAQYPAALLVIVCDPNNVSDALRAMRTIRSALQHSGIVVHRVLATHSVIQAGRWIDPDT